MNVAPRNLFGLNAADLMTTTLVLLHQDMSLQGAARIMSRANVTGAPVVDHEGRLVGIFSATDYMLTWNRVPHPPTKEDHGCMAMPWSIAEGDGTEGHCTIADFMTKNPVTVPGTTPIAALAQMMVEAHIHRVVVIEANGKPRGIVSTMDLLAALTKYAPREAMTVDPPRANVAPFLRAPELV